MSSIKDVAKLAGVSVATVSRVLNNQGPVSDAAVNAVLSASKELGYHPNLTGRNLRLRQTKIILVMLQSLANTFCAKVVQSIEKEAEKNGYTVMLCATNHSEKSEESYISFLKNKLADGMIILSSSLDEEAMKSLSAHFPLVQCNEYTDIQETTYISVDNYKVGFDAVSLLAEKGAKRIAFMGVDNNLISSKLRFDGYKDALKKYSLPFDEKLVVYGNYGYRNAYNVTEEFLKCDIGFDAFFAISDRMAAGVAAALLNNGYKIPRDVQIIGVDNTDISYISSPQITTVAQPADEIGKRAALAVIDIINGNKTENVIVPHSIITRQSTKQ